ncbi:MAG: ribulose-phosphate 3-epimerase, partial [Clostridia bacterium]|nr:ribulose-phosphate 3-epimerase [Clostridia bacterium]
DVAAALALIRSKGVAASLSIKPKTPAKAVFPYLDDVSMILVMTVEPGFGGQALIEDTLLKVQEIRRECVRRGLEMDIQVDGGISPANIGRVAACGANVFVAGSAVFGAKDAAAAIAQMRAQCVIS